MKKNKIGFIGLGLIGGSIGKAIKKLYPDTKMYGHASRIETLKDAYAAGIIENNDFMPISEFGDMDILFLCSPVQTNQKYLAALRPHLKKDVLLTDVGSVKGDIHKEINRLGLSDQFIGGHPMTGSEKTGFLNSDAGLLKDAYYILTYEDATPQDTFKEFTDFVASLGAIPLSLSPEAHDFATAAISHLPHILSASLVNLVKDNDADGILKEIAAGGFKDITRISSSSPIMWQNICLENREQILHLLSLYRDELDNFAKEIAAADEEAILSRFSSAKEYRDTLPK